MATDSSTTAPSDTSRVGAGAGCGLAILFGGWIVLGMLMTSIMQTHMSADNRLFYSLACVFLPAPVVVTLFSAAVAYRAGRRRFGKGMLYAVALVPGVLVAIFGFFALLHL